MAALILHHSEEVVHKHYIKLQEGRKKAEAMAKLEETWEHVPEKPCGAFVKQSLPN